MNRLAENAIKLNDKFNNLRAILRPAIEAAREREKLREGIEYTSMSGYPSYVNADWERSDEALLEAGKLLGVE